jgi:hypothetical protein
MRKETEMEQMEQCEAIVVKLRKLPEPLIQEVNDFIDFLLTRREVESDFSDYLSNLENYEDRLARGEIQW